MHALYGCVYIGQLPRAHTREPAAAGAGHRRALQAGRDDNVQRRQLLCV
jgi:hypothetical protein